MTGESRCVPASGAGRLPHDQPDGDGHHQPEEPEQQWPDGGVGEGVHALDHTRPGQEGPQDGQGEGGAQQRQVPDPFAKADDRNRAGLVARKAHDLALPVNVLGG